MDHKVNIAMLIKIPFRKGAIKDYRINGILMRKIVLQLGLDYVLLYLHS